MNGVLMMTDLYLLGLLSIKEMSGYEMEQYLKNMMIDSWGGILVGSIYYALNKLEKRDYIRVSEIKSTGKRQTKIYEITELGKVYKKECIVKCLVESQNSYPTYLFSGAMFINELEKEEVTEALNTQLQTQNTHLELMKNGEREKGQYADVSPITDLTFNYIYQLEELKRQYIQDIICLVEGENANESN